MEALHCLFDLWKLAFFQFLSARETRRPLGILRPRHKRNLFSLSERRLQVGSQRGTWKWWMLAPWLRLQLLSCSTCY